jgi:cytochrome c
MSLGSHRASIAIAAIAVIAAAGAGALVEDRQRDNQARAEALAGGDADAAQPLFRQYGCAGCHTISGVPGASGTVGPPLSGIRQRIYIAGVTPNTTQHLLQFIVDPHSIDEKSAMPATGISLEEARHVVAYLYAH